MWVKGPGLTPLPTEDLLRKTKSVLHCASWILLTLIAICPDLTDTSVSRPNFIDNNNINLLESQGQCSLSANHHVGKSYLSAKCLLPARKVAGTQPVDEIDLIPKWTNHTLFAIGQKFATKNIGYLGISHLFALIFENFIPDIKDVLLTTGSSYTTQRAIKRYTATATQVLLWYRQNLEKPSERRILLDSLLNVRKLHLDGAFKAQMQMKGHGHKYLESRQKEFIQQLWSQQQHNPSIIFDERFWLALEKDLLSSNIPKAQRHFPDWENSTGTPISQFAQSLTQFSFVGLPVLFHKELGISHVTQDELHGYVHMWAVLGHALGIKDEFNICMSRDFQDSRNLFRDIFQTYFIPAMFKFDWRVRVQLGSYLDALFHMDQVISPRLIMFRFLRDFVKILPYNLFSQMNVIERMYLALIDSILSNNLEANRFLINRGGAFFLDSSGYHHFGEGYSTDAKKSRGVFYTRDKLVIE